MFGVRETDALFPQAVTNNDHLLLNLQFRHLKGTITDHDRETRAFSSNVIDIQGPYSTLSGPTIGDATPLNQENLRAPRLQKG
jgi:hypothetical protein